MGNEIVGDAIRNLAKLQAKQVTILRKLSTIGKDTNEHY